MELPYEISELLASGFFRSVLEKTSEKATYPRSQADNGYPLKEISTPAKKVPRPTVEDEIVSLLRESCPIFPCHDPPFRGTIDQDPIIMDSEIPKSKTCPPLQKVRAEKGKNQVQQDISKETKVQKKTISFSENDESCTNDTSSRDESGDQTKPRPRRRVQIMSSRSGSSSPRAPEKSKKHRHIRHETLTRQRSSSPQKSQSRHRSASPQKIHVRRRSLSPPKDHARNPRTSNTSSPSREGRLVHANDHRKEISLRPEILSRSHKEVVKKNPKCPPLTVKRRDPSQPGSNLQVANFTASNKRKPTYYGDYLNNGSGYYPEADDHRHEIANPPPNPAPYPHELPLDYPTTVALDNSQAYNYSYMNGAYSIAPGISYPGLEGGYGAPYIPQPSIPAYDGYGVPNLYTTPSTALIENNYQSYHPEWQAHTYQQPPSFEREGKIIRFPGKVIKHLPPCPRTKFSHEKNGWLTLPHCPNFDICSFCFESSIAPTEFEKFFTTSPRPPPTTGTLCDFGSSPWYRIAWLTILTKDLKSLNLFYDLANVAVSVPPCPEGEKTVGYWWSIVDPWRGNLMPGFRVCLNCVSNIEVFFPVLRGVFVCIDKFDARPCACHMRINKKIFIRYFDMLEIIAADADTQGLPPDTRSLARLIEELEDTS